MILNLIDFIWYDLKLLNWLKLNNLLILPMMLFFFFLNIEKERMKKIRKK